MSGPAGDRPPDHAGPGASVVDRLGDGARLRLERWLEEMREWSARMSLSTVPPAQAWERHVVDSLSLLEVAPPPHGARVVDVGSGAGAPGVPLAVARPDLRVVLLDADGRRCGFLVHVSGLLGLRQVEVVQARAEEAGRRPGLREGFDVAVSRATAPAAVLCELALPLVREGGVLVALVAGAAEAVPTCRHAARACGGGEPRAAAAGVLVVPKDSPTPDAYPRRSGVPARRPLRASTSQ